MAPFCVPTGDRLDPAMGWPAATVLRFQIVKRIQKGNFAAFSPECPPMESEIIPNEKVEYIRPESVEQEKNEYICPSSMEQTKKSEYVFITQLRNEQRKTNVYGPKL